MLLYGTIGYGVNGADKFWFWPPPCARPSLARADGRQAAARSRNIAAPGLAECARPIEVELIQNCASVVASQMPIPI
jgi:hypothetical protein